MNERINERINERMNERMNAKSNAGVSLDRRVDIFVRHAGVLRSLLWKLEGAAGAIACDAKPTHAKTFREPDARFLPPLTTHHPPPPPSARNTIMANNPNPATCLPCILHGTENQVCDLRRGTARVRTDESTVRLQWAACLHKLPSEWRDLLSASSDEAIHGSEVSLVLDFVASLLTDCKYH